MQRLGALRGGVTDPKVLNSIFQQNTANLGGAISNSLNAFIDRSVSLEIWYIRRRSLFDHWKYARFLQQVLF